MKAVEYVLKERLAAMPELKAVLGETYNRFRRAPHVIMKLKEYFKTVKRNIIILDLYYGESVDTGPAVTMGLMELHKLHVLCELSQTSKGVRDRFRVVARGSGSSEAGQMAMLRAFRLRDETNDSYIFVESDCNEKA